MSSEYRIKIQSKLQSAKTKVSERLKGKTKLRFHEWVTDSLTHKIFCKGHLSLVSCPTRWSLYWYLGFCDDHLSTHHYQDNNTYNKARKCSKTCPDHFTVAEPFSTPNPRWENGWKHIWLPQRNFKLKFLNEIKHRHRRKFTSPYLIFVTDTTDGVCVKIFCPV